MKPNLYSIASWLAAGWLAAGAAHAATVSIHEDFSTDPVAAGRATIQGNAGRVGYTGSAATLAIDSEQANTQLLWALPQHITDQWTFTMNATFSISSDYSVDNEGTAQLVSFGMLNSVTTGSIRSGYPLDTFDLVSADYFPQVSSSWSTLTLTPTVFGSAAPGQTNAFDAVTFPEGSESLIDGPGEVGVLSAATEYTITIAYDAISRTMVLTLSHNDSLLTINSDGGLDGDPTTIELTLGSNSHFDVDQLGLFAWQDVYDDGDWTTPGVTSALGTVTYSSLNLTAQEVPEPTTMGLLVIGGAALIFRRR